MDLITSNVKTMSTMELAVIANSQHSATFKSAYRLSAQLSWGLAPLTENSGKSGRPNRYYNLNKNQSLTLVAQLNPAFLAAIVDRWQELEQANYPKIPQTYAAALLEAGRLAGIVEEQSELLAIAAPKVEFYDQVTDSTDAVDMASAAKVLNVKGMGRNKLFALLRDEKVLQQNNQPYQKHIDAGRFRVIESSFVKPNGDTCINIKTVIYQRGLDYVLKLINKEAR